MALTQHLKKQHAIEWKGPEGNQCGMCATVFAFEDDSIVDHLITHAMKFEFLSCNSCAIRCRKLDKMKTHLITHHAIGPADGFKNFITNLKELFDDVLEQKNNKQPKQSKTQETENAIAGLMGEEFATDEYEEPYNGLFNVLHKILV